MYITEKDEGLNNRSLIFPRGKVIGGMYICNQFFIVICKIVGCSAINAMIYSRG